MIFTYGQKHFRRQVGARCLHVTTTCEKPFSQTDIQGDQLQRLDFLCARADPLFLSLPAADMLFLRLSAVDAPLPSPPATYPLFPSHGRLIRCSKPAHRCPGRGLRSQCYGHHAALPSSPLARGRIHCSQTHWMQIWCS